MCLNTMMLCNIGLDLLFLISAFENWSQNNKFITGQAKGQAKGHSFPRPLRAAQEAGRH